jgi:hypothetical protein
MKLRRFSKVKWRSNALWEEDLLKEITMKPLDHSEAIHLDEIAGSASQKSAEILGLDQALDDLARVDARKARVIEPRFFGA